MTRRTHKIERNIWHLDLDRLQEVLDYDPQTGIFTWRIRTGPSCKLGQRAGYVALDGYRKIGIDGRSYTAGHLAWFYFYEVEPEGEVDFINLNKDDTRIANLRLATRSQNARNMKRLASNTTGFKGVARFNGPRNRKRYRAQIRANGKRIFLGLFATPEEAYKAYCKKAKELHGEFARLK
jgi:hypothetical protein